ncbi:hypothetical protein NMG60_11002911 [Bertholletia excelsa]
MEVKHFSHDHSLTFNEMPRDNAKQFNCYACEQSISGPFYDCKRCLFFLHESCVELPQDLTHFCHPKHPLILRPNPPTSYSNCVCDICRKDCTRFIYHCSSCKFDVDINCALVVRNIQQRVEHTCHQHQLIPLQKLALFLCDACGTEHKGSSYLCTSCGFWAIQQCVSLPTTIKLRENCHSHPLKLTYYVPYECDCKICHMPIYRRHWIYGCHECRYLTHVNCLTPEIQDCKANVEDQDNGLSPISLPMPDECVDPVTQFIKDVKLEGNYREEIDIVNNSHKHPLTFFDDQVEDQEFSASKQPLWNIKTRKDKRCNGCQQTISIPFYYCAQCNFSLHQWCAELPKELWHPIHPEHPLQLITDSPLDGMTYECECCCSCTNGYVFGCTSCKFYLDIKCVSLPRTIKHDSHKDLLGLRPIKSECSACGERIRFGYECDICKYNLDIGCALLPWTIKHRYDEHPFALIYGASSLDQVDDEYYCEICEKKVHSEYWFYHCHDCDQSLHTECIRPAWWLFSSKYAKGAGHGHCFKVILRSTYNTYDICGENCEAFEDLLVECSVCRYVDSLLVFGKA